jgi:hypothetical protein
MLKTLGKESKDRIKKIQKLCFPWTINFIKDNFHQIMKVGAQDSIN